MRIYLFALWVGIASALTQSIAFADSAIDIAQKLVGHYLALAPAAAPSPTLSPEKAQPVQKRFVATLEESLGKRIGYKVALTNPAAQKQFGVSQPLTGILLEAMLRETGSSITAKSGIRLMFEADLLVRVGDANINKAQTHSEILSSLSEVIPLIEVPDLVYGSGQKLNAGALIAINAGARYGITGKPIPLQPTIEWMKRLADFHVSIRGANGEVLAEGKGSNLLGQPLQVVLWLRDQLRTQGVKLQEGDLISLGSITRLIPVKPNTFIQATYDGLAPDGPVVLEVRFK